MELPLGTEPKLVAACVLCVWLLFRFLYSYFKFWSSPLHKIPGPKQGYFSGAFREIWKEPYLAPHKRWCQQFGYHQPFLHYSSLFGTHSLLILDKDIVHEILHAPIQDSQRSSRFTKLQTRFLRDRVGDGLVTLEGSDWKRHRRILQPAFQTNLLKEQLDIVVPPIMERMVQAWNRGLQNDTIVVREIDAASHLSTVTLDVVGQVLFSHDFQGMKLIDKWADHRMIDNSAVADGDHNLDDSLDKLDDPLLRALMDTMTSNFMSIIMHTVGLGRFDKYINSRVRKSRRALNHASDQVIVYARKDILHPKSLLHLMLVAEDPEKEATNSATTTTRNRPKHLSATELRDETTTFLMAGHETTATWLYWSFFALAKHPDVQEKLYNDIMHHAPKDTVITLKHTEKMVFLQVFLQEVLRLYPPAGIVTRTNTQTEFWKGHVIPAGTRLTLPIHLLHRHPLYWDDPELFKPERWLEDNAETKERHQFAFLPFSNGMRNCIGQRFAAMEAQLVLAYLARAFVIRIAPSQRNVEHSFTSFITMKAKPSLKVELQAR